MAQSEAKQPAEPTVQGDDDQRLKYLDFVQASANYAVVSFSSLYEYAKGNFGPLKPGVRIVEGTVKTVVGPVYQKLLGVPFEIIKFVDRKVDKSIYELDRHVPLLMKQASCRALSAAQKAPEVARAVASEIQRAGVVGTAANVAKMVHANCEAPAPELYRKYEPVAEHCVVSTWLSLNRLPLFPLVAGVVLPTAAYWTEKFNQAVCYTAEKGFAVSSYLPLVPIERIAKVLKDCEDEPAVKTREEEADIAVVE